MLVDTSTPAVTAASWPVRTFRRGCSSSSFSLTAGAASESTVPTDTGFLRAYRSGTTAGAGAGIKCALSLRGIADTHDRAVLKAWERPGARWRRSCAKPTSAAVRVSKNPATHPELRRHPVGCPGGLSTTHFDVATARQIPNCLLGWPPVRTGRTTGAGHRILIETSHLRRSRRLASRQPVGPQCDEQLGIFDLSQGGVTESWVICMVMSCWLSGLGHDSFKRIRT